MTALAIIEKNSMTLAARNFIVAEKSVLECEQNISQLAVLTENHCLIRSAGKNIWLITSKQKPSIQVHVYLDEKTGVASRLNWRQSFD
jgi:hypothetical protein